MGNTFKAELTNMVMVYDKNTNRAVVQQRVKYWKGIPSPAVMLKKENALLILPKERFLKRPDLKWII